MGDLGADPRRRDRSWIAALLGYGEFLIDAAVAIALTVGGVILLGVVLYDFVRGLGRDPSSAWCSSCSAACSWCSSSPS